ncbi:anaphase-promoting complex subunit 2-like [Amphibalanus amphitrite]|uniref:anaphase-promoting complex subunit 2-like n=1 Tax=Amphibalanus amphitrite TaxID=1232801 RepID=UPI001C905C69|nr:anaphase-promoting complex subunit 2-like [Amphibalanus amphitrite]
MEIEEPRMSAGTSTGPGLLQLAETAYLSEGGAEQRTAAETQLESACRAAPARLQLLQAGLTHQLRRQLLTRHAPAFWRRLLDGQLPAAVDSLYELVTARAAALTRLQTLCEQLQVPLLCRRDGVPDLPALHLHLLESALFSQLAPGFADAVREFFERAMAALRPDREDEDGEEEEEDGGEDREEDPAAAALLAESRRVCRRLSELRLLGPLAGGVVADLICRQMAARVDAVCQAGFTRGAVGRLDTWCEALLADWRRLLGDAAELEAVRPRAVAFMYQMFARRRIAQLFDIIVDFPDSGPALEDLRVCLQRSRLRSELVTSLRKAVATRLLHPAANTEDILSAYVSAVRALRLLEPSGVLVDLVGEPIRQYLRGREDTVRCIVASLTEEGGGPLAEELVRGEPVAPPADSDMTDWQTWTPYPRDAPPAPDAGASSQADIISMLVNIYGSKNTFVKEYRKLLADRILKQATYDLDRELKYLELLKRRFGDAELHECDVMLKDLFNSHRINWHIHSEESRRLRRQTEPPPAAPAAPDSFPVHSLILSAQFWPDFREETLALPESYERCLEEYTREYQTLKGNRTLCWKRHLGTVELEVELPGRTLTLSVTPVHAVILHHFQSRPAWTAAELGQVMKVPVSALRRKVAFWLSQGILTEPSPDHYRLNEGSGAAAAAAASGGEPAALLEDDADSPMTSTEDQKERDLEVFWNYIVGMLTNLASLPLERIQAMLRLFAMDGAEQCSTQELRAFLDKKVKQHKLLFSGGLYRLPKP